jgi:hypothetical protein
MRALAGKPLARIPLVDLRGYTPLELLFLYRTRAQILARGALQLFGPARFLAAVPDRASRRWLEKSANPYLAEITQIAGAVGVPGTFLLNTCVEWGCTAAALASEHGPVLQRVLDWPFPRLGELCVVVQFRGMLGDYFAVTWPGFSGVLQGMAPGRFAAAINQAPMRKSGGGLAGDWLAGRIRVGKTGALPPTHLLRQVFETARDYQVAKTMLCQTKLAVPIIYTLTGTRPGEGCVIERTEDSCAVREMGASRACATNQFETPMGGFTDGWRPRPIDSAGRYAVALTLRPDMDGFGWFVPPIANVNSRLVMTANAATGTLKVLGTDGMDPATEVFDLPA